MAEGVPPVQAILGSKVPWGCEAGQPMKASKASHSAGGAGTAACGPACLGVERRLAELAVRVLAGGHLVWV